MSKSYRKPYFTWSSVRDSAHEDKKLAARGVRRAQNHALRTCEDWDEFLIPHRLECSWNNVYSWKRDGHQREYTADHNDYNPFWLNKYRDGWTYESLIEWMLERIERYEEFRKKLCRK